MAEALNSPFGNRPDQLESPVPGQAQEQDFLQQLSQVRTPRLDTENLVPQNEPNPNVPQSAQAEEVPTEVAPPTGGSLFDGLEDEISASFGETETPVDVQEAAPGEPSVGAESFPQRIARAGVISGTKEGAEDLFARFKASFTKSKFEKAEVLKSIYGEDNVRLKKGEFEIQRPGEKGFRAFDPFGAKDKGEAFADLLDITRDMVEGGAAVSGEVIGGIGGALVGNVPGAVAGAAAGGATGGVIGLKVGDFIAQNILGIQKDPARQGGKETVAAGVLGGIFGGASRALNTLRAAKTISKPSLTTETVAQKANQIAEISENLAQNGINMKQGNLTLSPGQLGGELSPELREVDRQLSTPGPVRDFFVAQGKLVEEGFDTLKAGVSNVTGRQEADIFRSVKQASKLAREVDGAIIGDFRKQALAATKGRPKFMSRTAEMLPQKLQDLGFVTKESRDAVTQEVKSTFASPTLAQLKEKFPDANAATLGNMNSILTEVRTKMQKGQGALPLSEVDGLYTKMRGFIDNNMSSQSGRNVAKEMIDVKNALRDDWTQAIGAELGEVRPGSIEAYRTAMQKYGDIIGAQDTLRTILKKHDLSAAAFSDQIFSPARGKERIGQLKVLLEGTEPGLWNELVDQKINLMHKAAVNPITGRTDWLKLTKQFDKLERAEVLGEMLEPEQKKLWRNFLTVAKNVDSTFDFAADRATPSSLVGKVKNLAIMAANVSVLAKVGATANSVSNVIAGVGKDKAMKKWLAGEGLELVLKDMPKNQRKKVNALLGPILFDVTRTAGKLRLQDAQVTESPPNVPEVQ